MRIGIGIDTGGTYTDAVVYDFESKEILGSAKSLTTKDDLSIGILGAIDALPIKLLKKAQVISLSTTLATNACVENKGGRAKLIFFGGNKRVIDELGGKYGLPPSKDIYIQESYTKFSGEIEREVDWELFRHEIENEYDYDGVGIVEMNAMRNGAFVEKKAKEIFSSKHDIPVVCGYELFSELNCLQRSSSTLLNAGLFPVIKEFLNAIKKALAQRDIHATLVIVRSDGSLMSEEFAAIRPVETLLCGPAASTIGGTRLTDTPNSIIIDMGGTTTDIALVTQGEPVTVVDGVSIGKWKTFVEGLYIKTFGLGGDSAVHYNRSDIYLEETRIVPLCVAAQSYPSVLENLQEILSNKRKHSMFLYEHYLLTKDISKNPRYSEEEKMLCEALRAAPLPIAKAAQAIGKDLYTMQADRLIKDGIIQICGLTPTDIMHIKKDFNKYSSKASVLGAKFAAFTLGITVDELCERVYSEVKRKIYLNVVKVCLENKYPHYLRKGVNADVAAFADECYRAAKSGNHDPLLSLLFRTEYSLVGIGAPIHIFLEDVAKLLGTNSVIPKHYEVANALGAVIGNISATYTVEVKPDNKSEGTKGYIVYGSTQNKTFKKMEDAEEFAIVQAKEAAKSEAIIRGAKGEITLSYSMNRKEAQAKDCVIYLGTIIEAHAVGAPGF